MCIRLRDAEYTVSVSQSLFKATLIWDHLNQQIKVIFLLTRVFCYHRNGLKKYDSCRCRSPTWTARLARRAPQEYDPDCVCSCGIKSAAYRMQPYNPPSAYEHDHGATMAILKRCLPADEMSRTPDLLKPSCHNQKFWLNIYNNILYF